MTLMLTVTATFCNAQSYEIKPDTVHYTSKITFSSPEVLQHYMDSVQDAKAKLAAQQHPKTESFVVYAKQLDALEKYVAELPFKTAAPIIQLTQGLYQQPTDSVIKYQTYIIETLNREFDSLKKIIPQQKPHKKK